MKGRARSATESVIGEMSASCLLMRTRLISRVVTALHDEELRPYGIGSPQFALLVVLSAIEPATRAQIGRLHHQDRSTLTRNLKVILAEGWAVEVAGTGRGRPLVVTGKGKELLRRAEPAWRAGQVKTRELLGKKGISAVMDVARRIMSA